MSSGVHIPQEFILFWRHHDDRLPASGSDVSMETLDLTHNLYRGMPVPFNRFFAFWQQWAIRSLIRERPPRFGERALDLGCGTGRWSRFLLGFGVRVVGIDIGIHALLWAHRWAPSGSWAAMAIPQLGFRSGSFDWVFSVTVLQHLPYEMQEVALLEIHRVLHPGGCLILLELCRDGKESFHIFPRPRWEWEAMFARTGFRIIKKEASERLPWIPFMRRLIRWKQRGSETGSLVEQASVWFREHRWPWIGLYLFLAIAYPLEGLAAATGWNRWARYMGWLLEKEK